MPRFFYSASNLSNRHDVTRSWWQNWRKKKERKKALRQIKTHLVEVNNPFVRNNPTKKTLKFKIGIIIILLIIWGGGMLFVPYFQIKQTTISGINIIKSDELNVFLKENFLASTSSTRSWWRLPTNNYFLLNSQKIARAIQDNFAVEKVEVKKIFPHCLQINIQEKISSVIYDNGKDYFLLNEQGIALKHLKAVSASEKINEYSDASTTVDVRISSSTLPTTSTVIANDNFRHKPNFELIKKETDNAYPLIYDQRVNQTTQNTLEPDVIVAVLAWHKLLLINPIGEAAYFVLDNLSSGLELRMAEGWTILFNIHGNHLNSFKNLETMIAKNGTPTEYIDLRYGERIYWK